MKRRNSNCDLYIRDKQYGSVHRIGDYTHDMMMIDTEGVLHYHNLQNGDGCRLGDSNGGYEFVPNVDEYGYNANPMEE